MRIQPTKDNTVWYSKVLQSVQYSVVHNTTLSHRVSTRMLNSLHCGQCALYLEDLACSDAHGLGCLPHAGFGSIPDWTSSKYYHKRIDRDCDTPKSQPCRREKASLAVAPASRRASRTGVRIAASASCVSCSPNTASHAVTSASRSAVFGALPQSPTSGCPLLLFLDFLGRSAHLLPHVWKYLM